MKKTLYRALTLLVSVALLLSLASPAFATTTTDTFLATSLPADIVISSAMNGIGVLPAADPVPYEGIVTRVKNWLIDQGKVVNDKIDVWKRSVVSEGQWQYGADVSLIEAIRSWLFDEDIVTFSYDFQVPADFTPTDYSNNLYYNYVESEPYILFCYLGQQYVYVYSQSPFLIEKNVTGTSYIITNTSGTSITSRSYDGRSYTAPSIGVSASYLITYQGTGYSNNSITDYDVTLGYIRPGAEIFGEAYPDWYRNIATIPLPGSVPGSDDDEIHALPIAPGNTLSDTFGKTQEQVWTGQSSYTESVPDAGTGSLADVIAAIVAIPSQIINGLKDLFIPNISNLTFPLQNFFPFCIPFDLYEFFTLLSAEPEAPVFEWEIPVPQLGRTFELEVDLSPWNDVAELFRNLELLAFIVGLAYVTREKFLRS